MRSAFLSSGTGRCRRINSRARVRHMIVAVLGFIVGSICLVPGTAMSDDADPVAELKRPGLHSVRTIASKFQYVTTTDLSDEEFWGLARTVPGLKGSHRALIASDGRWRIEDVNPVGFTFELDVNPPGQHASGQAIRSYYNKVAAKWKAVVPAAPASLELFDGFAVWSCPPYGLTSAGRERDVYRKSRPDDMEPGSLFSSPLPDQLFLHGWNLSRIRSAFPDAAVLPESLREEELTPVGTRLVEGEALAVFQTSDGSELYLDKKLGYALRKKIGYFVGEPVQTVIASDFEQVAQGVWLPRQVHVTQLGHKQFHPSELHGKSLWRTEYFAGEWTINSPEHESRLAVAATPGAWVIDTTVETGEETVTDEFTGAEIKSQVAYLQPADESTLQSVVEDAKKRRRATSISQDGRILGDRNRTGVIGLIVLLIAIGAALWWRTGPILPPKRRVP